MALAGLIIVLCGVIILIDLYLTLGWISPDLSIRIEQKIRKSLLNKQPIIILDPWYISRRNSKLSIPDQEDYGFSPWVNWSSGTGCSPLVGRLLGTTGFARGAPFGSLSCPMWLFLGKIIQMIKEGNQRPENHLDRSFLDLYISSSAQ